MLEFHYISKSFSGVEVLHQITFSIEQGKIIALMGENGAGKSTLMKILAGIYPDYEGQIVFDGREIHPHNPREAEKLGIAIIHQELNLIPDLSIGENIFLGKEPLQRFGLVNFSHLYQSADKVLQEFKFPYSPRLKVRHLTVGWRQMVEIARVFQVNARLVIMDEPTSALSDQEIPLLFDKIEYLKKQGKTIIFISHRLREAYAIADEIVILRDGYFVGKYAKTDISRDQLISLMIGHHISSEHEMHYESIREEKILEVKNLTVVEKNGLLLKGINFTLRKGEILGIAGLLGSGRTELLKFLYGELKVKFNGEIIYLGQKFSPHSANDSIGKGLVYLSEDRQGEGIFPHHHLQFNGTISHLDKLSVAGFIKESDEKSLITSQFDELQVKRQTIKQPILTLSGGNQQKVLLARILLRQPLLLLLDEPTRGIDVGAKEEIYQLIAKLSMQGVTIIMSSSEIPELLWITQRILVLSNGEQSALLETQHTNSQEILKYAFTRI